MDFDAGKKAFETKVGIQVINIIQLQVYLPIPQLQRHINCQVVQQCICNTRLRII